MTDAPESISPSTRSTQTASITKLEYCYGCAFTFFFTLEIDARRVQTLKDASVCPGTIP